LESASEANTVGLISEKLKRANSSIAHARRIDLIVLLESSQTGTPDMKEANDERCLDLQAAGFQDSIVESMLVSTSVRAVCPVLNCSVR
jgi:hypothetical protein